MKTSCLLTLVLAISLMSTPLSAETPVNVERADLPKYESEVTDLANALSPIEKAGAEADVKKAVQASGRRIAVLIMKTISGQDLRNYTFRVYNQWQWGAGDYPGVLLLIATDDKQARMEFGQKENGSLHEESAKALLASTVKPACAQRSYQLAICNWADMLPSAINGSYAYKTSEWYWVILFMLLFVCAFASAAADSDFFGGLIGAFGAGLVTHLFGYSQGEVVFAAVLGLAIGFLARGFVSALGHGSSSSGGCHCDSGSSFSGGDSGASTSWD